MRNLLVAAFVIQFLCLGLSIYHNQFLKGPHSENRIELGKYQGRKEIIEEILRKGGTLPDGTHAHPNKGVILNLDSAVHELIIFYPLLLLQVVTLVLLAMIIYHFTKMAQKSGNRDLI